MPAKNWLLLLSLFIPPPALADKDFAPVLPDRKLVFPRDEGAHPAFRTEWWYATGWLQTASGKTLGFQVTFFRSRTGSGERNPSRFAPTQVLVAHAALSDPEHGKFLHDQRMARQGFGLAQAEEGGMNVQLDRWKFIRVDQRYQVQIPARGFSLELSLEPTQPPLLQGENGFSRKSPAAEAASHYYSQPHLRVTGTVVRGKDKQTVTGTAWLDHEWSSHYLDKEAAGWDWVGLNLDDGGALMAFRMRSKQGDVLWAGGTHRDNAGRITLFRPRDIRFQPLRQWISPRSSVSYPIAMQLQAGDITLQLDPLMDDQELDARRTTGAIYWEGAVRASRDGSPAGQGYLELTGYAKPMKF